MKLGSLFKLAREAGWSKPVPDIGTLFSAVEPLQDVATMSDIRVPPPGLDLRLGPSILIKRAEEVGVHVGCDPLIPLFAGMAIAAAWPLVRVRFPSRADALRRLDLNSGIAHRPVTTLTEKPADLRDQASDHSSIAAAKYTTWTEAKERFSQTE